MIARAAKIIIDVAALDDPPLRLLPGAGAVDSAAKSSADRAAEAESGPASAGPPTFPPVPDAGPRPPAAPPGAPVLAKAVKGIPDRSLALDISTRC